MAYKRFDNSRNEIFLMVFFQDESQTGKKISAYVLGMRVFT